MAAASRRGFARRRPRRRRPGGAPQRAPRHDRHAARGPRGRVRPRRGARPRRSTGWPARASSLEDAVVQVPQTRPSHASIFTGRYPYEHGIRDNYSPPLAPGTPTLASILRERGLGHRPPSSAPTPSPGPPASTRASPSTTTPSPAADDDHAPGPHGAPRRRRWSTARSTGWRSRARGPSSPGSTSSTRTRPTRRRRPSASGSRRAPTTARSPTPTPRSGASWTGSTRAGLREPTLVVVTSDHGEGLGDHGEDEHMFFVYDSTLQRARSSSPGRAGCRRGRASRGQFRSVDLLPTVLDLAGRRRRRRRAGPRAPPRSARADASRTTSPTPRASTPSSTSATRRCGRSAATAGSTSTAPRAELYRLAEDPGETRNLVDERGPVAAAMRASARGSSTGSRTGAPVLPRGGRRRRPSGSPRWATSAGGLAWPGAAPSGRRPQGQDRRGPALHAGHAGGPARSTRTGQTRARAGPASSGACRERLAAVLQRAVLPGPQPPRARRFAEAFPLCGRRPRWRPPRRTTSGLAVAPVYAHLVEAYAGAGRDGRGPRRRSTRPSPSAPANAELLRARGSLLLRQGDLAGARAALEKARSADAREPRLHVELSSVYREPGSARLGGGLGARGPASRPELGGGPRRPSASRRPPSARRRRRRRSFREALRLAPDHPDALFYLGAVELRAGRAAAAAPLFERLVAKAPEYPQARETLALAKRMTAP